MLQVGAMQNRRKEKEAQRMECRTNERVLKKIIFALRRTCRKHRKNCLIILGCKYALNFFVIYKYNIQLVT
jgi:hypothetical protein